jgi:5-methylcytosine-specific restriction endonuclease McrA
MKLTRAEKSVIRHRIFERAGGHCEHCGICVIEGYAGGWSSMNLHHIVSRGAGGDWEDSNLECLCLKCHLVGEHNPKSVPSKA